MSSDKELMDLLVYDLANINNKLLELKNAKTEKMIDAMFLLKDSVSTGENIEKVVSVANEVEDLGDEYPVLSFFFYLYWFLLDVGNNRRDEAEIIILKLRDSVGGESNLPLRAEYLLCSAMVSKGLEAEKIYKNGLSLLPKDSNRFLHGCKTVVDHYSKYGKLLEVEPIYFKAMDKNFLNHFQFINAIENGQIELALKLNADLLIDFPELPKPAKARFEISQGYLDLYLGKTETTFGGDWLDPIKSLMKKDAELSLKHARTFYENHHFKNRILTSIGEVNLLRAHLVNKNVDAVSDLFERWQREEKYIHLLDFFYSRFELLNNRIDKAVYHFAKALQACKKYDSFGRLDFELDLSLELKPRQIRYLIDEASKLTAEILVKPIVNEMPSVVFSELGVGRLKGDSTAIASVKEDVIKYATLDIPVLVLGETGVGKDVVAKAIHEESPRKDEPFIAINCSAIAENLLQSELFGHEAGAYTGATKAHKGVFQEAGKGTVFLDEIGDISSGLQVALLRVLESEECRPVGSAKPKPVHCRVIAATNANLELLVEKGQFRLDLFYRLKRLVIKIPPLRERPSDIIYLMDHFANFKKSAGKKAEFDKALEKAMLEYHWPGNVRELKNEMEKMRLLHSEKSVYKLEDLNFLSPNQNKKSPEEQTSKKEIPSNTHSVNADSLEDEKSVLQKGSSFFRRIERIKSLFLEHKRLSRKEIFQITKIPNLTLGRDLKYLREEGFIVKLEPTKSPRTHYFALKDSM